MADNPVNPDAQEIGRTYGAEPSPTGRAGGGKQRLNAAYVACLVALLLVVLAAVVTLA